MSRLKITYIFSLVILAVLIGVTVFKPMAVGGEYSEVERAHLLEREDQWIIEYDIINQEGKDISYTITVMVDGKQYNESVLIPDGRIFTYIHHISRDKLKEREVSIIIYKEGKASPLEEATYYLK